MLTTVIKMVIMTSTTAMVVNCSHGIAFQSYLARNGANFRTVTANFSNPPQTLKNSYRVHRKSKKRSILNRSCTIFTDKSHQQLILRGPCTRLYSSLSSDLPLKTLANDNENEQINMAEQVIKKSRFIGIAKHCTSWKDAQNIIKEVNDNHPKSRHICFAFVSSGSEERCSDDGEPTGTAGQPILGGIKGEGLSDTLCMVVRYSGGIKLGAGGLIRAYGGTARLVLRVSPTKILIPRATIRISTPLSNVGQLYDLIGKFHGDSHDEVYSDKGDLQISITCDLSVLEELKESLTDATRGQLTFVDDIGEVIDS